MKEDLDMNSKGVVNFCSGLSILLFAFILTACKKENRCDCIKRTGDIIQETRDISGFTQVQTEENVNVFITQDSVSKVIVEAGENIVPLITTEVVGNTLVCGNRNRCNWTRSYKKPLNIYVHLPKLTLLEAGGTGNVKSTNTIETPALYISATSSGNVDLTIQATQLTTSLHGNADLTLHGYSSHHDCSVLGTAYLLAGELHTDYTYIHIDSLGQSYVNVSDLLICKLDLKGDLFCYGNPKTVDYQYSNTGRLYLK